jgi:lipopolysaccharide export system protein LptC
MHDSQNSSYYQTDRHLKQVKFWKRFLISLAFLFTLIIIIWPLVMLNHKKKIEPAVFNVSPISKAEGVFIQGEDKEQGLYEIKVTNALQDQNNKNFIYFNDLYVKLVTPQGETININSEHGYFEKDKNKVYLNQDVHLVHTQGYDFKTSSAIIELNTRVVSGQEEVIGGGPLGKIKAQGFQILDKGERVLLGPSISNVKSQKSKKKS